MDRFVCLRVRRRRFSRLRRLASAAPEDLRQAGWAADDRGSAGAPRGVGCRHCTGFNRRIKRSCVRILELVNMFRQVQCFSARASFLLQGFPPVSYPQILAHTDCVLEVSHFFIIPCDGSLLLPVFFCVVPCALGEDDGVIRSQFFNVP